MVEDSPAGQVVTGQRTTYCAYRPEIYGSDRSSEYGQCSGAEMTSGMTIVSGPNAPISTVRTCDVGGEPLPADFGWWLVSASGRSWTGGVGAACAVHCRQPEVPMPARAHRLSGYSAAIDLIAETAQERCDADV